MHYSLRILTQVAVLTVLAAARSAAATITLPTSIVEANANGVQSIVFGTSTNASSAGPLNTASASIDLTTATLRASASGTAGASAEVLSFSSVSFTGFGSATSATVTFSWDVDGSLFNADPNALAVMMSYVDITGPNVNLDVTANGTVQGRGYGSNCPSSTTAPCFVDSSGAPIPFAIDQTASFVVVPNAVYSIDLELFVFGANSFNHGLLQGGDFSNTALFQFTDLGGTTLVSANGEFQSSSAPEPTTLVLISFGLAAIRFLRRRHKSMSAD